MSYNPEPELRQQFRIGDVKAAVCLFVDIQNYNCHPEGAWSKSLSEKERDAWQRRVNEHHSKWSRLQAGCRAVGVEVMYCVIQSLTKDGRERSMDYKISGFLVPSGNWNGQVLDCIKPDEDEIVLPKGSCSVFQSTNLDYLLRCMEKSDLIMCGCMTDQCVSHAVRDGCDLGYRITVITDCCLAMSETSHQTGLQSMAGFSRLATLEEWISETDLLMDA